MILIINNQLLTINILNVSLFISLKLVEMGGIEPPACTLRTYRSPI